MAMAKRFMGELVWYCHTNEFSDKSLKQIINGWILENEPRE